MYNIWYGYFQDVNHDKCDEYKKETIEFAVNFFVSMSSHWNIMLLIYQNNTELIKLIDMMMVYGVCIPRKENGTLIFYLHYAVKKKE